MLGGRDVKGILSPESCSWQFQDLGLRTTALTRPSAPSLLWMEKLRPEGGYELLKTSGEVLARLPDPQAGYGFRAPAPSSCAGTLPFEQTMRFQMPTSRSILIKSGVFPP